MEKTISNLRELFQKSPFEPLRLHMGKVMECAAFVQPMFKALRDGDYEQLELLARKVFKVEHQADIIKAEIRRTIPKRFVLPIYRGDLLGYLKSQDDMADSVEDIAVLLTLKKLKLHPGLVDATLEYVSKVEDICQKTQRLAYFLPTVVAGDLAGVEVEQALQMVADIEKTEWEADRLQYALSQKLFTMEDEMKPTELFLLFRIFGELGQLANFAEKCGDRIRRMLGS